MTTNRKQDTDYLEAVVKALRLLGFPVKDTICETCQLRQGFSQDLLYLCICGRYLWEYEDGKTHLCAYAFLSEEKKRLVDKITLEMAHVQTREDLKLTRRSYEVLYPEKLHFSRSRGTHNIYEQGSRSILIPSRVMSPFDVVDTALHELLHLGRREECENGECLGSHTKTVDVELCPRCARLLMMVKHSYFRDVRPVSPHGIRFLREKGIRIGKHTLKVFERDMNRSDEVHMGKKTW